MQKIILLIIILLSETIFSAPKITENEKFTATCKVSRFLKDYYPKVAGGVVNWDNQHLEKLPKIKNCKNNESRIFGTRFAINIETGK